MYLTTAYKFRIYPDAKRQAEINKRLVLAQRFYNKLLQLTKESYLKDGQPISMSKLNRFANTIVGEDKSYMQLYSQTRCEIKYRLLRAYQNFFRRVRNKERKKGFPRFKSIDRYKSIAYPQDNGSFSIEKDRLRVSRIGTMKMEMHRKIEGKVKTLAIKKEAGKYFAIFTAVKETEVPEIKDMNPAGIDLGLTNFIALSDGKTISKQQFMKGNHKKIAHWQRVVARRNRGSKRRQKAKEKLEKAFADSNRQNEDFMHKLAKDLVENSAYTSFAVEDLSIKNMMTNRRLSRSIHNASWNKFEQFLSYKAANAGMEVIEVNPRLTTQRCSRCSNVKETGERLQLQDRMYHCFACGLVIDRDVNAAINIRNEGMLKRATAGHAGSNARGDAGHTMQRALQTTSLNREHTLRSEELDLKGSPGV